MTNRTRLEIMKDVKQCLQFSCIGCSYSGRKNKNCIHDLLREFDPIVEEEGNNENKRDD